MLDIDRPDDMDAYVGQALGASEWVRVTQDMIDLFADATGDHQWIHVDVARAKTDMPGGCTIAHGFLTLSLLPRLSATVYSIRTRSRGLNYGSNRVRFTSPCQQAPASARIWSSKPPSPSRADGGWCPRQRSRSKARSARRWWRKRSA